MWQCEAVDWFICNKITGNVCHMLKGAVRLTFLRALKIGITGFLVVTVAYLVFLQEKKGTLELTGELQYGLNSWEKEQFRTKYGCSDIACDAQKDYNSMEVGSSLTRDELVCCSDGNHFDCMHAYGGIMEQSWWSGGTSCSLRSPYCHSSEAKAIFPYLNEFGRGCLDGEGCGEILNPNNMLDEYMYYGQDTGAYHEAWPKVCGLGGSQPPRSTGLSYTIDRSSNFELRKAPPDCNSSYDCNAYRGAYGSGVNGECVNGKCVEPEGLRCGEAFSCGQQTTCGDGAQTGVLEWCDDTFIDQYFYTDICWKQEVDCSECDAICASGTSTTEQQQICGCENQPEEPTPVCGNNTVEGDEECDDGNTTDGDGCTASCVTEECGDGTVQAGLGEECDDGNTANGDGCSASCETEEPTPVCGNNTQEGDEQCDDGNTTNGDGCSASCEVEESADPCAPVALNSFQKFLAFVGIEVVQELPSTCFQCCISATTCVDMAGSVETDKSDCRVLNDGWAMNNGTCPKDPTAVAELCNPCGNARLDTGEKCDPTSANSGNCTDECKCKPGYIYNADKRICVLDTSDSDTTCSVPSDCTGTWCGKCPWGSSWPLDLSPAPWQNPCCPNNYVCAPFGAGSQGDYRCKKLIQCFSALADPEPSEYFCNGTEQCIAAYDANGKYDPEGTGVRCQDNICCGDNDSMCGPCPGGNSADGGPNESPLSPPDDNNAGPNQPTPPPTGPSPSPPPSNNEDESDSGPRFPPRDSASSASSESTLPSAPQCEAGVCQDRQACFDGGGRCFDVGFSCAEGDTTFETCCCIPFDSENPQHLICEDNQCVLVDGEGEDQCAGDNDCAGDTHLECRDQQCTAVPGAGRNTCTSDDDCRDDMHFGCLGNQCTLLPGARSNTCSGDNDCMGGGGGRLECVGNQCVITMSSGISTCVSAEDCAEDMHMGCENEQCTILPGAGADTCSTNDDCTDQVHLACQDEACVFVPGAGANECDTALDCGTEQHTECQDDQCVLVDGPGGNECSTNVQCGKHTECQNDQCVVVDGAGENTCATNADCVATCPVGQECTSADVCMNGGGTVGQECGPEANTVCCTTVSSSQSSLSVSSVAGISSSSSSADSVISSSVAVVSSSESSVLSFVSTLSEATSSGVATSSSEDSVFSARTSSSSATTVSSSRSTQIALQSDSSSSVGHLRCISNSCVFVPQNGVSTCSTDADCFDEDDDQIRLIMGDTSCGNNLLEQDEECDDGDREDGDGCSASCTLETSDPRSPTLVAAATVCGNGLLEDNEECDDGNRREGDGCTARCLLSIGMCGDGIVQSLLGEQCESSRHDPLLPYLCNNCRFVSETCGDGTVDAGEECDNGTDNSDEPDASCRLDCSVARCGDGILDAVEQCDDGNRVGGDGCDQYCLDETGATDPDRNYPATQVASEAEQSWQFTTQPQQPGQWLSNVQFPNQPNTQGIPMQLPFAQLQPFIQGQAPVGDTGPAAVAVIGAGAAAGWSWIRRRKD